MYVPFMRAMPVRKISSYLLLVAALTMAGVAAAQTQVDLTGVWRLQSGTFRHALLTSDGQAPPLLPEAAAIYEKNRAAYRAGDLSFDRSSTICLSPGMPRMVLLPYPFQIIQRPHQLAFIFEWNSRFRLVDMTGKPAVIDDLSYMGTAVGKVEADQVVIHTQALNDTSLLDANGMPHSDELRLTERYRLKDRGKTLVSEITIEDPKTFSRQWQTTATYKRLPPGTEIQEDVCRARLYEGRPAFEFHKWK